MAASDRAHSGDRPKEPIQIVDTNSDEADAKARRWKLSPNDPSSEGVDADAVEKGGLLERQPFRYGMSPDAGVGDGRHGKSFVSWIRC